MKEISIESFDNSKLAFATKTSWQLKKAYYLFKIVNNNGIARIATFSANLALKLHLPIKGIIRSTVFEHFCGGETIDDCKSTSDIMGRFKVGSILDYSVEGKDSEEAFDQVMAETLRTIENAKGNSSVPYCVFKPTGLGSARLMEKIQLKIELTEQEELLFTRLKERYNTLCNAAFKGNVRLLIDAEDSWYQDTIDELVYLLMEKYNKERAIVFNTYQMYRWQSLENIKKAHKQATERGYILGAKLVRGAYMEAERQRALDHEYKDPICIDKAATDKSYNDGLSYIIEHIEHIELFNGSHNEYSNFYLTQLMLNAGLSRDDPRVFFVQLYGMSDNITYVLADAGYNAAKYLPYGPVKYVMPYLIRRAEENTSVEGQSSRELVMLAKEMKRRKNQD